jgi:endogenous inhibitor of DNA gyrase (YacG/DUF329 family)
VWGPQARYRPFCSERCKLFDLGDWASEKYRVASPSSDSDEPQVPDSDER